ncbi:hypothetical protein GQ53DRAFT_208471 [Thozetella sp. PMI_491]|nr:hypothetical protein GQ53DRAFT_208471 [Thozetella sp. PMI_491]
MSSELWPPSISQVLPRRKLVNQIQHLAYLTLPTCLCSFHCSSEGGTYFGCLGYQGSRGCSCFFPLPLGSILTYQSASVSRAHSCPLCSGRRSPYRLLLCFFIRSPGAESCQSAESVSGRLEAKMAWSFPGLAQGGPKARYDEDANGRTRRRSSQSLTSEKRRSLALQILGYSAPSEAKQCAVYSVHRLAHAVLQLNNGVFTAL